MPALTASQFDSLTTMIETAFLKHNQFSPHSLTNDDIVNAFVNPDDLPLIERVKSLYTNHFKYSPERIAIALPTRYFTRPFSVVVALKDPAYLPDYAEENAKLRGAPGEEKLSAEIDRYVELFRDYNLMVAVLRTLDELCANPAQIAFLWPTIRDLTAMAAEAPGHKVETLQKALDKNSSAPMPRIPMGLRDACKQTATTMTVLKMLGEPPPVTMPPPVSIYAGGYANIRQVYDPNMLAQLQ